MAQGRARAIAAATADGSGTSFALFGEFGIGNVGNDASCAVVVEELARRIPGASFTLLSRDAQGASRVHGLPAIGLGRSRPSGLPGPLGRAWSKLTDLVDLVRVVRRFDAVVVPGTGVLEARHGRNPGGVIVWLALLSLACRARGVPLAWVAVGGSAFESRVPAAAAALAARGAGHRSFRDPLTRSALAAAGLRTDGDASTYDVVLARPAPARVRGERDLVAVAPMLPPSGIDADRYLRRLVELVADLGSHGACVRLVVGDEADLAAGKEVLARVQADAPGVRVDLVPSTDLETLLDAVAPCAVVVASRYHVLVAALLHQRAMVALSHADKDDQLMQQLGMTGALRRIDDWEASEVGGLVRSLASDAATAARLGAEVTAAREDVGRELDRLATFLHPDPTHESEAC